MSDTRPDRVLARAVTTDGDELAFRALYRRHTPRLYRIAVRLTRDRGGLAEDLVHDTWLRAVEGLPGFRWESSLATWLSAILLNRTRQVLRSGDWRLLPEEVSPEVMTPVPAFDLGIDLEAAIAAVPEGARAVLVLHDIEGHTHEEIAEILGIEPGTSKSQLARARRRMRERLGAGASRP